MHENQIKYISGYSQYKIILKSVFVLADTIRNDIQSFL